MAKRFILVIAVVLLFAGLMVYAYSHYRDRRTAAGEVIDESGAATGADGGAPVRPSTRSDSEPGRVANPAEGTPKQGGFNIAAAAAPTGAQNFMSVAPTTDSISANPPNGTIFAGTGKFQVYRQGDLTWRVNTATGRTCILFATEEQWRKPIVYRNGCGRG